jgi:hypothetical protein
MSILKEKKIVDKYSDHINSVICKYPKNAELFLYEDKTIKIPANFVEGKYKEKLFNLYLDNENQNSSFVGKIKYDKNISPDSYVQNKIRLKAERKEKELNNKWFKKFHNGFNIGYSCRIADIDTDFKEYHDRHSLNITYNQNTILSDNSNSTILNNLIYIFNFVDTNFLITAINNDNFDLLKFLSTTNNSNFYQDKKNNFNDIRSIVDFRCLYDFLQGNQISLEKVLSWFFNNYLVDEFNIRCFVKITIETESNKYIEKCEHVVNRIHRILKIYNLYTTDKNFDRELIKLASVPLFSQLLSLNKKYVYITDSKLIEYSSDLFDSLCDRKENKVINLTDRQFDDLEEWEKQKVENLIKDGILTRDKNTINVKNLIVYRLLQYHSKYGVIPYYWIKYSEMSNKLNEWVKEGKAHFYNKLLTKAEADYFEYFLSNKFDNGKGLRNMYAHGADENSDESVHKVNYTRILFLLCLLVIKINEEFDHEKFFEEYVNEFHTSINYKMSVYNINHK